MRLLGALLLALSTETPQDLKPANLRKEAPVGFKLLLPEAYEPHPLISRRFERKPSIANPDIVTLRLEFRETKLPLTPVAPVEADLMRIDPALTNLKFKGSVETWRGRPVPSASFEGFIQGKTGVFGRMVWLPLEPGTVVLELYCEPSWVSAMRQDWDAILANLQGPIAELTLRERAPGRWLAAKILTGVAVLFWLAGLIMILARMTDAIGGGMVYVGLLLPVVPLGYALLHFHECRRGLLAVLVGILPFAVSLLLER